MRCSERCYSKPKSARTRTQSDTTAAAHSAPDITPRDRSFRALGAELKIFAPPTKPKFTEASYIQTHLQEGHGSVCMFLIRFITRAIGFLIVMRLMMGGPDLLFTGLVLVFWGPLVAVAVLLLGAIESTIGNYGTISTYIGIVLTSIGCFTPLLLTGGMFSPPLMPEWFWEKTSILWWAGWMATGLLMKNRSSPRPLGHPPDANG
jgi:hypothetical protein